MIRYSSLLQGIRGIYPHIEGQPKTALLMPTERVERIQRALYQILTRCRIVRSELHQIRLDAISPCLRPQWYRHPSILDWAPTTAGLQQKTGPTIEGSYKTANKPWVRVIGCSLKGERKIESPGTRVGGSQLPDSQPAHAMATGRRSSGSEKPLPEIPGRSASSSRNSEHTSDLDSYYLQGADSRRSSISSSSDQAPFGPPTRQEQMLNRLQRDSATEWNARRFVPVMS
jgi:hypothetical protein